MTIVTLRLADVKTVPEARPPACPYCGHGVLQGWGWSFKAVRDPEVGAVRVRRYRCCGCRRTFRHYPTGIGRASQSVRMQQLAALSWRMGLSLRGASLLYRVFRLSLAHMTIWRDVQRWSVAQPKQVRSLGLDGFYTRLQGAACSAVVAVDLGSGQPVALAQIPERDVERMVAWLKPLVDQLGVEVIVTDDLNSLAQVVVQLDKPHQVCSYHLRRWVGKALRQLAQELEDDWQASLDEVRRIVRDLPPDGRQLLFLLWQRIGEPHGPRDQSATALYRLRQLVLRLHDHWEQYVYFQTQTQVPATNNGTERAIERWRTRSRSVRSFKSWSGLESAFRLCNSPLT